MADTEKHIQHKRSSGGTSVSPKLPTANQIEYGEIAVNYLKDGETLSIKNTNGEIVTFSSDKKTSPTDLMVSITWSELGTLKTNNQLIKGAKYRITDYITTTVQANTISANHPFDIIVTADDVNKLNENARAIQHSGDTYFADSNLEAWELKYSLWNDTSRFAWAAESNGKGVIYYMKDEFGNECPYDFKNIQFIKPNTFKISNYGTSYLNTYTYSSDKDVVIEGVTYYGYYLSKYSPGPGTPPSSLYITATTLSSSMNLYTISDNVATRFTSTIYEYTNDSYNSFTFDLNSTDASLLANYAYDNIIKEYINNSKKQELNNIYFHGTSNTFLVCNNKIYNNCYNNVFSHYCQYNTLGSASYGNTFGASFINNSFGGGCNNNSFDNNCHNNSFGSGCYSNSFGDSCSYNSFGNECYFNSFGNGCYSNSFGNECYYNSFGMSCQDNSFGNNCIHNSFGNTCQDNSFGNECNYITFEKSNTRNVIVENGNKYITLTSTQTTSSTNSLRNITIAQGYNNTETRKTISHNTLDDTFRTTYGNLIPQITHGELRSLRSDSNLTPGQSYRITDYVTTTVQADTQSANHAFDIIVTADDVNKLNENAKAIQHSGDTYFANSKLEAWEIKYCLDNDTSRFAWADETNGKGVIYYMKDEFGNECPYDFKNIQYVVETESYYTFDQTLVDGSLNGYANNVYGNVIKERTNGYTKKELNKIYFHNTSNRALAAYDNKFGVECGNISFGNTCHSNTFGTHCYDITFNSANNNNTFGDECGNNTLGTSCSYNAFGGNCTQNTLMDGCTNNSFGNGCYDNSFGNNCDYNSFGSNCDSNSFGSECRNNSFGGGCENNSFGNGCDNNSFGNNCHENSFGNSCDNNSFGNNCIDINYSGISICLTVESGVRYIEIVHGGASTAPIYNVKLSSGLHGTSTTKKTITIPQSLTEAQTKIVYGDGSLWVDGVKQTT